MSAAGPVGGRFQVVGGVLTLAVFSQSSSVVADALIAAEKKELRKRCTAFSDKAEFVAWSVRSQESVESRRRFRWAMCATRSRRENAQR